MMGLTRVLAFFAFLHIASGKPIINQQPQVTVHSHHVFATEGSNVSLTCKVFHIARNTSSWQWKFNGNSTSSHHSPSHALLNDNITMVLDIFNVSERHGGLYECEVFSALGSYKNNITLVVGEKAVPRITRLFADVDAYKTEDKAILCGADGWPPPLIKWKRNNVELKDSNDYSISVIPKQNQAMLILRSVDNKHEGDYTCEASNAFGKSHRDVHVTVIDQPPRPKAMVDSHYMIASEGSNVTLECKVLHVQWYLALWWWKFNGNSIIPKTKVASPHYSQSKVLFPDRMTMVLDIVNVSKSLGGFYECYVFSSSGDDKNNITLMVGEKENYQNISANWKTVNAATNTQVQLQCITNYPAFLEAETFWMFQGVMLNDTGSIYKTGTQTLNSTELTRTDQMSLWINNITDPDFGRYTCVVNTSLGMSLATISVVKAKTGARNLHVDSY